MTKNVNDNMVAVVFLAVLIPSLCFLTISLLGDIRSSKERVNSHKDVVCSGMIVLSGSGYVYKDEGTYTLAGKTYQMKDGETCWINDSYVNVEVK